MRKLLLLLTIVWSNSPSFAQKAKYIHMPEHDDKAYYFGLAFGGNSSYFQVKPTKSFYLEDKFQQIQGQWGPGFSVGIMSHLKLSNFVDLRFIPSIIFTEGGILLEGEGYETPEVKNMEAIYMQLPLHFKFKSDRIDNFRFYAIAGMRFDYDLASNAKSRRADEWLRVKPIDIGVDFGIGLEFYFPNFIFAPEIKIGQGVMNRLKFDPDINLSYEIDKIQSRMITFSIHLQG